VRDGVFEESFELYNNDISIVSGGGAPIEMIRCAQFG